MVTYPYEVGVVPVPEEQLEMKETTISTLLDFAEQLAEDPTYQREGLADSCEPLIVPASVLPVTEDSVPLDDPLDAITWEVSPGAITLILDGRVRYRHYAVQFPFGDTMRSEFCTVRRRQERGPFTFVGLEVVKALDCLPFAGPAD